MRLPLSFESNNTGLRSNALSYAIIIATTFIFGALLLVSFDAGFKWFFVCFMSILAVFSAAIFPSFRLFSLLLLTACISVAVQFDLLHDSSKTNFIEHHGGATDSVVISLVDFPIILLFLMWVKDLATNKVQLVKWSRIDTYICSFIIYSCFSLYNTSEYAFLMFEILRYLKYYLLLWILRSYFDNELDIKLCLYLVVVICLLQFLVSALQYFFFFTVPLPVGGVSSAQFDLVNNVLIQRVTGLVGHANTFAAYLMFPVFTAFTIFLFDKDGRIRFLALGFFVVAGMTLVLTFSRNIWLMCAFFVPILVLVGVKKERISGMFVVALGFIGLLALGILAVSGVLEIIFVRIFEDDGKAYDSRWDLFKVSISMIIDNPLFGIGLNSFEETMSHYDEVGVTNIIRQPVHNISFLIMSETGFISFVLFLMICKKIAEKVMTLLRSENDFSFFLGLTVGITFLALFASNQMDITLRKEPIMGMCVLFIAMIYGLKETKRGH